MSLIEGYLNCTYLIHIEHLLQLEFYLIELLASYQCNKVNFHECAYQLIVESLNMGNDYIIGDYMIFK